MRSGDGPRGGPAPGGPAAIAGGQPRETSEAVGRKKTYYVIRRGTGRGSCPSSPGASKVGGTFIRGGDADSIAVIAVMTPFSKIM